MTPDDARPSEGPTVPRPAGGRRAAPVRRILAGLARTAAVRGAMIVAPDGFLIAAELPAGLDTDALAALAATLGRELELGAGRLNQGTFDTAVFSGAGGTLVVGGSPVGFLAVVAARGADVGLIRVEMKKALARVQEVWSAGRAAVPL